MARGCHAAVPLAVDRGPPTSESAASPSVGPLRDAVHAGGRGDPARTTGRTTPPSRDGASTAAFGSPAEATLVERIRASTDYRPDYALVAELDGAVVGHVMVSDVDLRRRRRERRDPQPVAARRRPDAHGPGHRLGARARRGGRVDADGHPLIVLEGSPVYYARFGFEDAREHGIRIDLPDWAPPEAARSCASPRTTRRSRATSSTRRRSPTCRTERGPRLSGSRRARRGRTRRRPRRPAPGRGRRAW